LVSHLSKGWQDHQCLSRQGNKTGGEEMEKTESYTFPREEVLKLFEEKLGKKISRIRFSSRTQAIICEVGAGQEQ